MLKEELPPYLHASLLKHAKPIETHRLKEEKTFVLGLSDSRLMPQLRSFYWESILERLQSCIQNDLHLEIRPIRSEKDPAAKDHLSWLNPNYRFEAFLRNRSNLAAALACEYVAAILGKSIPLILHGGGGLGKTHLVHALAYEVEQRNSEVKIGYLSFADFCNCSRELSGKRRGDNKTGCLIEKCLQFELLVIEDISFENLEKERLGSDFLYVLDHYCNNRKQLVLTSRQPTPEKGLNPLLLRKLHSGLQTYIQPPSRELQIAFLRKHLTNINFQQDRQKLPDLLPYCNSSLDRLETFLEKATENSRSGKIEDPLVLEKIINQLLNTSQEKRQFELTDIVQATSSFYKIDLQSLFSNSRKAEFTLPRHVAMYLATRYTGLKKTAIARFFRRCDHTTVLHAERKIAKKMEQEPQFCQLIEKLVEKLDKDLDKNLDKDPDKNRERSPEKSLERKLEGKSEGKVLKKRSAQLK